MKLLAALMAIMILNSPLGWENDFAKAKQTAATENKLILLNFSGSDWCGPCIRMHKEIFETADFSSYASEHLLLVNADFPRQKKHQLSKTLQLQNEHLADLYNPQGSFPFTVLLTADGKVVKAWDGFPKENISVFISEIKSFANAGK